MEKKTGWWLGLGLALAALAATVLVPLLAPAYGWLLNLVLTLLVALAFAVLLVLRLAFKKPVRAWPLVFLGLYTLLYLPGYTVQLVRGEQGTLCRLILDRYPDIELEDRLSIRPDYESPYGERTLLPEDIEFTDVWGHILNSEYRTIFPQERVESTYPQDTVSLSGTFWVQESDTARRQERVSIHVTILDEQTVYIRMGGGRNTAYRALSGLELSWLRSLLPAQE